MAKNKIGALMVIEQDSPLDEYTESGNINVDQHLSWFPLFWGSLTRWGHYHRGNNRLVLLIESIRC